MIKWLRSWLTVPCVLDQISYQLLEWHALAKQNQRLQQETNALLRELVIATTHESPRTAPVYLKPLNEAVTSVLRTHVFDRPTPVAVAEAQRRVYTGLPKTAADVWNANDPVPLSREVPPRPQSDLTVDQ